MKFFLKRYRPFRYRRIRNFLAALCLCQIFVFGSFVFDEIPTGRHHPHVTSGQSSRHNAAIAQPTPIRRIDPIALAEQVYQQLPDLPRENQYISSETGDQALTNTLIARLIRYHVYIKNRATVFRLDWKLTIADYLGAFEQISASNYPDNGLQENPYQNDMAAIDSLSVEQRNILTNTLYETFTATDTDADSPSDTTSSPDTAS